MALTPVKFSALTAASALGGTEAIPAVQAGANVRIAPTQIATYLTGLANAWTQKQTLSAGASIASAQSLDWNSDLFLFRGGANILQLRNGSNAQTLQAYNLFIDASNYERGIFDWKSEANVLRIGAEAAGTGVGRDIRFITSGSRAQRFTIGSTQVLFLLESGFQINVDGGVKFDYGQTSASKLAFGASLIASVDNTYDIGASGANRPRNLFIAGYTKKTPVAVASLPAAATAGAGAELLVNDALAPAFGATVAGSGAVTVPVYSDGTNWKVG